MIKFLKRLLIVFPVFILFAIAGVGFVFRAEESSFDWIDNITGKLFDWAHK